MYLSFSPNNVNRDKKANDTKVSWYKLIINTKLNVKVPYDAKMTFKDFYTKKLKSQKTIY